MYKKRHFPRSIYTLCTSVVVHSLTKVQDTSSLGEEVGVLGREAVLLPLPKRLAIKNKESPLCLTVVGHV